jgi:hypothetical protein
MINVETGEIKLDDYGIIFHVDLTLEQFRNGHTPPLTVSGGKEHKYSDTYYFKAAIDGLNARFCVDFSYTKLARFSFWENIILYDQGKVMQELIDATKISHEHYLAVLKEKQEYCSMIDARQQEKLNHWLAQTTNTSPPYEYPWGEIKPFMDMRGSEDPGIVVTFRKEYPEGMDYKTYYQDRREREERWENQFKNAKPLSRFPQGFSRKTK